MAFEFAGFELSTGLPEDKTDAFAVRLDAVKPFRRKRNSYPCRESVMKPTPTLYSVTVSYQRYREYGTESGVSNDKKMGPNTPISQMLKRGVFVAVVLWPGERPDHIFTFFFIPQSSA